MYGRWYLKTTRDSDPNVHLVPDKRPQLSFASEDPGTLSEVQLPMP